MLSGFAKLSLTATSIAPVGFTYAFAAFLAGESGIGILISFVSFLLIIICISIFWYAIRHVEPFSFKIVSLEAADRENLSLLLIYLLPLFTTDFESLNWLVWVPSLVIIALVVGTGYSYHFNPILGVMGWHFYRASTPEGVTYVLLTKKQLRSAKTQFKVGQLTEYIVVEL